MRVFIYIALLIIGCGCLPQNKVKLGMSPEQVINEMGQPDSKSIVDGKVLRKINDDEARYEKIYRIVYGYEKDRIQIWFFERKVTGMTRNGASVL